jgi:hypothetical protein
MQPHDLAQLLHTTQPNQGTTPPHPDEHPASHPNAQRAWIALMLAPTPHTWQALLEGRPVDAGALDQEWLGRLRTLRLL